jgi:hypothetical protein
MPPTLPCKLALDLNLTKRNLESLIGKFSQIPLSSDYMLQDAHWDENIPSERS